MTVTFSIKETNLPKQYHTIVHCFIGHKDRVITVMNNEVYVDGHYSEIITERYNAQFEKEDYRVQKTLKRLHALYAELAATISHIDNAHVRRTVAGAAEEIHFMANRPDYFFGVNVDSRSF